MYGSAGALPEPFSACTIFLSAGKWSKLNQFGRFKALMSLEGLHLSAYVKKIRGYYHRFGKIAVGNKSIAPAELRPTLFPQAQLFISAGKWSKLNGFGRFKALMPLERSNLLSYKKKIRGYYHRFWKIAVRNQKTELRRSSTRAFPACMPEPFSVNTTFLKVLGNGQNLTDPKALERPPSVFQCRENQGLWKGPGPRAGAVKIQSRTT